MRGTEFTYSRTAQPEKYESHSLSMTYSLDEHDDEKAAVLTVMEQVNLLLGAPNPSPLAGSVSEILQVKETLGELEKAKADKIPESEKVATNESKPRTAKKTESKVTEVKEDKPVKKSKAKAKKAVKATAVVSEESSAAEGSKVEFEIYDREKLSHKKILGGLLNELYPNWRQDIDVNKKAKVASKDLTGENLVVSGTSEVVPSFLEALSKAMA